MIELQKGWPETRGETDLFPIMRSRERQEIKELNG